MALEATVGDDGMVYIRETEQPDVVAVTTAAKWEAFVKGVMAGEFDHFVAGVAETDRCGRRGGHCSQQVL